MTNFVLIHGAMHGGWCWERVVPLLERAGHVVIAPDLPGLGADRTPASAVTLAGWTEFVVDILQRLPGETVLAGHSLGGMVISQAAESAPERIATLVYVTALLPAHGRAALDLTRGEDLPDQPARLEIRPASDGVTITSNPEHVRAFLYNETEREWADRALSRLVPQPLAVLRTPAALSAARFGGVPRAYIECLRDRVLPIALQRRMQAVTPCQTVRQIDTDHSPFYAAPDVLAAQLLDIAATSRAA